MIIKCYNENHPYLLFIDIEFDNTHLIQFAGLLFKRIDTDGSYQLQTSINQYVSAKVGYPLWNIPESIIPSLMRMGFRYLLCEH